LNNNKNFSRKNIVSELDYILTNLEEDRYFYEGDIDYEYTSFEESLKKFCDENINKLIELDDCEFAWECLSKIIEELYEIDDFSDISEDLFRACELLTYYIGKVMYNSSGALKNRIYNWIFIHIKECEYSQYVEQYLKPFLNGEKIYCSDKYYTDFDDFDKMILINKEC